MNFSFPKSRHLRKRGDFIAVQKGGRSRHSRYFVVVSKQVSSDQTWGRLGITVSKKVGNAAVRNRVKRVVREFVRGAAGHSNTNVQLAIQVDHPLDGQLFCAKNFWVPRHLDVVVIAKRSAADATTAELWAGLEVFRAELQSESEGC